jgi:hypothetical protein
MLASPGPGSHRKKLPARLGGASDPSCIDRTDRRRWTSLRFRMARWHGRTRGIGRSGLVPLLLLAAAAAARLPTLGHPLTEVHPFRQTQTAFSAVIYAEQGIDLLRPQVPVFGTSSALPFEFPVVQAAGALLIRVGVPVEVAMRGLGLLGFLASAIVLWALLRRHVNERSALIGLIVFVASPFALLFSRTSLIEYAATFAALSFVYAALEWHRSGDGRWFGLALIAGPAVALIKLTTAIFWIAPIVLLRRWSALLLAIVAAITGLAWSLHADGVRGANPYSAFLASDQLLGWFFGGDRLDPGTWVKLATPLVLTAGMLLTTFVPMVIFRRERLFWGWLAIALVAPLVVFTSLYEAHDYYAAAVTPALAGLIGGGLDRLLVRVPRVRYLASAAAVLALLQTANYWTAAYSAADPDMVLQRASALADATTRDDVVVTVSDDWSPALFFYADRRGYFLKANVLHASRLPIPEGRRVDSTSLPATEFP